MNDSPYDLFVIGAGSGGVRAARMAAQRGARVAIADFAPLGGTCVNLGCIPKKLYSFAAHYAEAFEESRGYGWSAHEPVLDWQALKRHRAAEIARLNGVYARLLGDAGVEVLRGRARVLEPGVVEVAGNPSSGGGVHAVAYRALHILVATGGRPFVPPFLGAEHVITSNDIFDLQEFPKRLVVVGGGYIACEFASIFRGLGAEVTQLYRGDRVLRGFDHEVSDFVAAEMRKKGIDLRTGVHPERVDRAAAGQSARLSLALRDGSAVPADQVLSATGRHPNTEGLGLAQAGVALAANGAVCVDANYATAVAGIHAVGDVIDRVHLTPVALAEAMAVVDHLFGERRRAVDYDMIPTAVFTHPNVGTVGLPEHEARAMLKSVRVYRSEFKALRHTLSGSSERTLMKLVVDADTDRVVGLHMVGRRRGRDRPGLRRCDARRRHQDAFRFDDRHPPDGSGRVRDHARAGGIIVARCSTLISSAPPCPAPPAIATPRRASPFSRSRSARRTCARRRSPSPPTRRRRKRASAAAKAPS